MTKQTITAMFDTRTHADNAAQALRQSGIPAGDVTISPENARDEMGTGSYDATRTTTQKTGFWASLEDLFGDYDDHSTYAEGVRRGGTLLTAHVDEGHIDRAVSLLEQHGAVDLEEREDTWRSEGWTGGSTGAAIATTGVAGAGAAALAMTTTAPATTVVATENRTTAPILKGAVPLTTQTADAGKKDVLQVVEERLDIGKRAVSRGKIRLHSYVVETAVSEDVKLRDEKVTIDRHAVDKPVTALGADAFKERTVEMEEINEEAVVAKTARVVEEVGIRKDVADRTETIRDTVRSTKVDVDDGRTVGTTRSGLGGTFAARLVKDVEVVGSDGVHVGIIDDIEGAMMKLKRLDPASSGKHHLLPTDLVKSVDGKAMLSIAAAEAMRRWTAV